jgi:xylulokinase
MQMMLGIDIGTTGVRALLVDEKGRVVDTAKDEYPLLTPRPGWAEQNPKEWWRATSRSIRSLIDSGAPPKKIVAVGLSGQMHGLVPMDAGDSPLRPAILWCDQRTVAECAAIERALGPRLVEITSNPALAGFTAPKILWMKRNEPGLYKKMKYFLLPKDYVRFHLTGERVTDISDAAGTLLLNVARGEWALDMIRELNIRTDILPPIVGSAEVCGRVTAEAARATGLMEGTPVVGGGADNTCAAVGAGIVRPGLLSSSIGSSGVIFAHTDKLRADPETRVHSFNHSVPGKFYLMGVMLSAGLSFRWFRDTFGTDEMRKEKDGGRDAYDQLSKLAQKAPPGCEGLLFLPYLNGERTPHKDSCARGVWFGISPRHGREHMVRSVMEGIVFGLKDSLDIMESLGIKIEQIRATGGGAKNAFWRQMQADVFGRPVMTLNHDEGPAYGAALLGGVGAGLYPGVAEAAEATVRIKSTAEPRDWHNEKYSEAHARFKNLYQSLKEDFKNIKF